MMDGEIQMEQIQTNLGNTAIEVLYDARKKKAPVVIWCPGPGINNQWKCVQAIGIRLVEEGLMVLMVQPSFEKEEPIQSTITTYLNDYLIALEWLVSEEFELNDYGDTGDITIVGIDRGAAAGMIFTLEDPRIRQMIALSPLIDPISVISASNEKELILRSAAGNQMRSTKLYEEDFRQNLVRLNLQSNIAKLDKTLYIFYGEKEDPKHVDDIRKVYEFVGHAIMIQIENVGHELGIQAESEDLPEAWMSLSEDIGEICQ